jgi:ketosteroid isomerase-like protein
MSDGDSDSLSPRSLRSEFERIVEALLDRRGDPRLLADLFAPEADWLVNGDPASWTYAGLRSPRDSVLAYLEAFAVEFERKSLRRFDTLIDGEQACVRYEMELRHQGTGREAWLPFLCFIRLEGDRIVEVCEMFDSASLFRLRESRL